MATQQQINSDLNESLPATPAEIEKARNSAEMNRARQKISGIMRNLYRGFVPALNETLLLGKKHPKDGTLVDTAMKMLPFSGLTAVVFKNNDTLKQALAGEFAENQTIAASLLDAAIGMFPITGEIEAARDVTAIVLHMYQNQEELESKMAWTKLVLSVMTIIPVAGGVIKGVGKLSIAAAKDSERLLAAQKAAKAGNAAARAALKKTITEIENDPVMKEIVTDVNKIWAWASVHATRWLRRTGHGNAIDWINNFKFTAYTNDIIDGLTKLIKSMIKVVERSIVRFGGIRSLVNYLRDILKFLDEIEGYIGKFVPQVMKDLNDSLAGVRQALIDGRFPKLKAHGAGEVNAVGVPATHAHSGKTVVGAGGRLIRAGEATLEKGGLNKIQYFNDTAGVAAGTAMNLWGISEKSIKEIRKRYNEHKLYLVYLHSLEIYRAEPLGMDEVLSKTWWNVYGSPQIKALSNNNQSFSQAWKQATGDPNNPPLSAFSHGTQK